MHIIPADKYKNLLSVNSLYENENDQNDYQNDNVENNVENGKKNSSEDVEEFDFDSEMELLDKMESEGINEKNDDILIMESERSPLSANEFHINGFKLQFTFAGIIVCSGFSIDKFRIIVNWRID